MQSGQKRSRPEGLDLSEFSKSYSTLLAEAGLTDSALTIFLAAVEASEMTEDDLIGAVKQAQHITAFDMYLLTLGLACNGRINVELIQYLFNITKLSKIRKDVEHLIEAAKLDLVAAIKAHADPAQFTLALLKEMMARQALDAIVTIFDLTDSCYTEMITGEKTTFNGEDHAHIYKELIGALVREHRGADELRAGAAKQKENEHNAVRQRVVAVLTELGCDETLVSCFIDSLIQNQMQISVLTGEYNARLIRSVKDAAAKQRFIQQLLDEFHQHAHGSHLPSLTKRQRLDLLPEETRQTLLPQLERELSTLDYMYFTLDHVENNAVVMRVIEHNKAHIIRGEDVNDCCMAILPQHRKQVLCYLLNHVLDEEFIVAALNGLDQELVGHYLISATEAWMKSNAFSYATLLNITAEGSDLEKWIIQNMVNIHVSQLNPILKELHTEHGTNYVIHVLSLLNQEKQEAYVCYRKNIIEGAGKSSLKTLLTLLWQNHAKKLTSSDKKMLNTLSCIDQYESWVAANDVTMTAMYARALNRFLAVLPDKLVIAVMNSMQLTLDAQFRSDFLAQLKKRKIFLKNRYKRICNNYHLTEFINLCHRIINPEEIISAYNAELDYEDITTIERLIETKRVTIKAVRSCVLRSYSIYKDTVPVFSFTPSMNILLILMSKYAHDKFKSIVSEEFTRLENESGSFTEAVFRFPTEARVSVLKCAPYYCPANQLTSLFVRRRIPNEYKEELEAYVKRVMKRVSKRKQPIYLEYLQALYNANISCFLQYCRELSSLNAIPISEYLRLARNNQDRLEIVYALNRFLTVDNITVLFDENSLEISYATVSHLLKVVEDSSLKRLLQAEQCEMRLATALYMENDEKIKFLSEELLYINNAFQLGIFIGMLDKEIQKDILARHMVLINSQVKRQFVLARCHDENKEDTIKLLNMLMLPMINDDLTNELASLHTPQEIEHALVTKLPSSRFELVCEWTHLNGCKLFEADRDNDFKVLSSIIDLMPKHYQLQVAMLFIKLLQNDNQVNRLAVNIDDTQERADFIKRYKLTHVATKTSPKAIAGSPFSLFRQPDEAKGEAESPIKKARMKLMPAMNEDE